MASGVPEETAFATKPDIALEQMRQTIVADIPMNLVLADAGYGDETTHAKVSRFQRLRPPEHSSARSVTYQQFYACA